MYKLQSYSIQQLKNMLKIVNTKIDETGTKVYFSKVDKEHTNDYFILDYFKGSAKSAFVLDFYRSDVLVNRMMVYLILDGDMFIDNIVATVEGVLQLLNNKEEDK